MDGGTIEYLVGLASAGCFRITANLRHLLDAELLRPFYQLRPPVNLLESRFDRIIQVELRSLPTVDTVPLFLLGGNILT